MSKSYKDIESMVQKYVLDQLSETEREEFEAYFLDKPDVIEMVESVQLLNAGLSLYNRSGDSEDLQFNHPDQSLVSRNYKHAKSFFAGVAVTGLSAVSIAILSPELITRSSSLDNLEVIAFSTNTTRSIEKNRLEIDLSEYQSEHLQFFFKVPEVRYPNYQVRVYKTGTEILLWESEYIEMSSTKNAFVILPMTIDRQKVDLSVLGVTGSLKNLDIRFCHFSEACLNQLN